MRRSTIALVLIAVVAVAAVVILRLNDDAPGVAQATTSIPTITSVESTSGGGTATPPPDGATTTTTAAPGLIVPPGSTVCDLYGDWGVNGVITNTELVEASGLAVSRTTEDVLWSHNDSRDGARLYAFRRDGTDLGVFEVPGGFAFDWEDMSAGPDAQGEGNYLYVGDIGDNFDIRKGVIAIHRVEDLDPATMTDRFPHSEPIAFEYPDGGHNAEALFIDPIDPAVYVVTKARDEALVFRGSLVVDGERSTLELVTTLPLGAEVSGADMSADGSVIAFRGYRTVWMWTRAPGESVAEALTSEPCEGPSPEERQGESISFDASYSYWTLSEGTAKEIHTVSFDG
ncbi:MAG: hypothetical protein DWP92_02705 [Armatimonadetes bacterium]|nr:MAG: hypothetical protein DWP92_02705 [Armatimonadota bacterium]